MDTLVPEARILPSLLAQHVEKSTLDQVFGVVLTYFAGSPNRVCRRSLYHGISPYVYCPLCVCGVCVCVCVCLRLCACMNE
jgi:hypothetical protein